MKRIVLLVSLILGFASMAYAQTDEWQQVETILGRKGTVQEDVLKITFPRSDLKVKVDGVLVDPGLALTSWIAFKKMENRFLMMGDLVLLHNEVPRVTIMLAKEGIEVTALHNQLLNEKPGVVYLHLSGLGNPKDLAEAIRYALLLTQTPMDIRKASESPAKVVDWSKVEAIFKKSGQKQSQLFHIDFPRHEAIQEHGTVIPPIMGVASDISMQMVKDEALATGYLVLRADEVHAVIKELISHNLSVTALQSHMLQEIPRLVFLHFWGKDTPVTLAQLLKNALDKTNYVK